MGGGYEDQSRTWWFVVEKSDAPSKREPATNAHNVSNQANDAVLGLDILKVKLLNSIEQLSITVIKN